MPCASQRACCSATASLAVASMTILRPRDPSASVAAARDEATGATRRGIHGTSCDASWSRSRSRRRWPARTAPSVSATATREFATWTSCSRSPNAVPSHDASRASTAHADRTRTEQRDACARLRCDARAGSRARGERRVEQRRHSRSFRHAAARAAAHALGAFQRGGDIGTRSSACSMPTDRRSRPSPMPAAARASGDIAAWVIVAGCAIRLSTPPSDSARVKHCRPSRKARTASTPPSSSTLSIAPKPCCWLRGDRVARRAFQARVMHCAHRRVAVEQRRPAPACSPGARAGAHRACAGRAG